MSAREQRMTDQQRNLLITGATSALAISLINAVADRNNRRVLAVSRSELKSGDLKKFEALEKVSGVDLSNESQLRIIENHASDFFSEPFDVVHFAGDFWRHKPLINTDFTEIVSMITSHYITLCGVAKYITPLMMRNQCGRLVAFSCNSVGFNYPDMSPFTSAKAAVEAFIKCYANEYAPLGITATVIALPTMKTKEILEEKPNGDHRNYIDPHVLSDFILDHVLTQPAIATGNVVRLIHPSPTFYGMGYFERNPRKEEHNKAMHPTAEFAAAPSSADYGWR